MPSVTLVTLQQNNTMDRKGISADTILSTTHTDD